MSGKYTARARAADERSAIEKIHCPMGTDFSGAKLDPAVAVLDWKFAVRNDVGITIRRGLATADNKDTRIET